MNYERTYAKTCEDTREEEGPWALFSSERKESRASNEDEYADNNRRHSFDVSSIRDVKDSRGRHAHTSSEIGKEESEAGPSVRQKDVSDAMDVMNR